MIEEKMLREILEYLERHLDAHPDVCSAPALESYEAIEFEDLENFIKANRKPTLQETLLNYIDRKGMSDADCYNRAGIDRRLFSKIRSKQDYHPRKNTIISLALALKLTKNEAVDLLNSAGYTFSNGDISDLIIQYFLENGKYDLSLVNQTLDEFDLNPLMGNE